MSLQHCFSLFTVGLPGDAQAEGGHSGNVDVIP